jgi:phosphatidylglycerol:prolipoprotein diacylglycerol transferase
MHPILFQWGCFTLYSYGVMVALGMLVGTGIIAVQLKRRIGVNDFLPTWILIIMLSAFIGARSLHALYYPDLFWANPLAFMCSTGGLVWYGGFLGGLLAFLGLAYRSAYAVLPLADAFVPGVLVGLALGRVGCFLAGCCYGTPCLIEALAVHFPVGHPLYDVGVHPVQLYESLGALVLVGAMYLGGKHTSRAGLNMTIFLLGYGVLRFALEYLRGDKLMLAQTLSASQWMSLLAILAGLCLGFYHIFRLRKT